MLCPFLKQSFLDVERHRADIIIQLVADIILKGSSPWFDNGGRDQLLATCPLSSFVRETGVDSPFILLPLVLIGAIMQESRS